MQKERSGEFSTTRFAFASTLGLSYALMAIISAATIGAMYNSAKISYDFVNENYFKRKRNQPQNEELSFFNQLLIGYASHGVKTATYALKPISLLDNNRLSIENMHYQANSNQYNPSPSFYPAKYNSLSNPQDLEINNQNEASIYI